MTRTLPDLTDFRTPFYLIDEQALINNLKCLASVASDTGCRVLLAQKAFSMYAVYPLIRQYLHGTAASGLYEARLGHDYFGGETHVFSPAFQEHEFDEVISYSDHLIFNSFSQWRRFKDRALKAGCSCGMRVNPQRSTQQSSLYDPCTTDSRLGVPRSDFDPDACDGLSGLHFHCLCEQNVDALKIVLGAFEEQFGDYIDQMEWVNFGGGHHITRPDYDVEQLKEIVVDFAARHAVTVYLEPGEAVALNAGYLVSTVVDRVGSDRPIAILDTSATCHMPDVLEVPYLPHVTGAGGAGEKRYDVRLGGPTCLAGDIIGDYSFDTLPKIGDQLVFHDMAIYTMVKNNTFNGMRLPDIILWENDNSCQYVRRFGYEDFKNRLS